MSNETDRLVSDAYNEVANETTPEALNQEILRRAAKAGRTRYSIARAWTRPVAWAATIGLSLVVVLELTNTPGSDMAPLPQSAPIDSPPPEASAVLRDSIDEESVPAEASEERQDALAKRSRPYSSQEQMAEKSKVLEDAPVVSEDTVRDENAAPIRGLQRELEADDLDGLQETMQRARQQVDRPAAPAPRAEPFAAGTSSLRAEPEHLCPAEARLSAEKWLECIQEIEASLPRELVEREYDSLRTHFPDFEHPAVNR